MAMVKARVTWSMFQWNVVISGVRKMLQAYSAPRAICRITAARAIPQRLLCMCGILLTGSGQARALFARHTCDAERRQGELRSETLCYRDDERFLSQLPK